MPKLAGMLLCVWLVASGARADARAIVVARSVDGAFSASAVQARVGEHVALTVAVIDDDGLHAEGVVRGLGRRPTRPVAALPAGSSVRWLRVEPLLAHTHTPSPNPGIGSFSNAVLTGPRHGRWLGYDTLEYDTQPLAPSESIAIDGASVTLSAAHPTDRARDTHGGAGSIWLAAIVTLPDGRVLATPDGASVDRYGLTRDVMRVSFRTGDDYLGWLSTYFNVPNLFGSSGTARDHQTDRYVGADCADVLVGGRRAMGVDVAYASVPGIDHFASPRTEAFEQVEGRMVVDGAPRALRWGVDVEPGDLVTIGYENPGDDALLPRAWDHIGTLVRDDGDGFLDGGDLLRHMSTEGLDDEPLSAHGHVRLRVYRWRR
jgi:hypothetical protein